ncbi:hypothetical protein DOTSEDRAFT_141038 [Dothistroma septosporum NZE10]|uniref:Uncharacterized protein n=1 Tax=Dothistroma septosporum (strain NZE10 / CBS 128990) TaxID=675120 RepID=N1PBP4_DOTSN|nr:hypothetical protein DOTSEDRAFT_141038 [Dothistroma septosporum NZE10]
MKVAELLSDLTSLQICDSNAAFALVSARPEPSTEGNSTAKDKQTDDPDLNRAKDLLELHGTVKLAHQDGTDKDLNEARDAVAKVLRTL